jgi:hypothetical protein
MDLQKIVEDQSTDHSKTPVMKSHAIDIKKVINGDQKVDIDLQEDFEIFKLET